MDAIAQKLVTARLGNGRAAIASMGVNSVDGSTTLEVGVFNVNPSIIIIYKNK